MRLLAAHVLVDGGRVGEFHRVALVIGLRFRVGLAADDMADGVDADLAPRLGAARAHVLDMAAAVLELREGREQIVAALGGEGAPGLAEGGVHRHRARALQARRAADHALQPIIFALEVERLVAA